MVQRAKEKIKRPAGSPKQELGGDARIKALEKERDSLKSELETARRRIAALEESRSAVASRIDWVIESLSGVVDSTD
jgi:sugar-specific transcriptional regulator TrmB